MTARAFSTLLFTSLLALPAQSFAEDLEVSFDLAQYTSNGFLSFSQGCIATPPTSRNNYVHLTAVWLEDTNGNYVTTLYRWGRTYPYNLKAWATASDMAVDGITRATPTSNGNNPGQVFTNFTTGAIDVSWLPDGDYRVRLESSQCELADDFRTGNANLTNPEATFTFTKGRTTQNAVNLGSNAPFNNVTIDYTVPGGNNAPGAWAGVDQRLMPSVVPADATTMLNGVVDDDSGTPNVTWTQVGSEPPGLTAMIATPNAAQTAVTFAVAGIYTFELTATDGGGLSSSDRVDIWVNAYTVNTTDDAEVYRGEPDRALGIIETGLPWISSWGQCGAGEDYSRSYMRFDMSGATGNITYARLRLPRSESTPNSSLYHDFYILTDAQDDWNGADPSTDWEATITFNNQSVPNGQASNLDAAQMAGEWQHDTCLFRHGFDDPDQPPGPASECPGWIEVPLDVGAINTYDNNDTWSIFMTTRQGCNNFMGGGSDENQIRPNLVVVEFWQSTVNQPPTADAGPDFEVTDTLPAGTEMVTLDGGGSSDDGGITSYEWREGGQLLGSSPNPDGVTVPLSLGIHDIELTVIDGAGLTATDTVQVIVEDRFNPNATDAAAAVVDGDPTGKLYDNLFAHRMGAEADWYAIDVVDNTDLDVSITVAGGDLDLFLRDSGLNELSAGAAGGNTETVSATGLAAGRYFVEVVANAPSTYEMTVTVAGPTISLTLNPSSAVESVGTLTGAGTVSVGDPAAANVDVMLDVDLPAHISFSPNPVTIPAGATSATFDITLVDDPPGAPDENRYPNITATAPNYNRGSAVFEILDDEQSLVVTWDKAAETIAETRSPLVVLAAELSGTPGSPVTIPFTISGTAEAGTDFEIVGGLTELTISGNTRTTLPISLIDDDVEEQAETIIITMGTPDGANAGSITEFILTITDDDEGGGPIMPMPMGDDDEGGCGCASTEADSSAGVGVLLLLGLLLWRRRR